MKRCYYEVLEIDRKATPAEIKTNYRKMALKYHPDKNSYEGSKERFVQINEAYNVLSDPNERTWYDNNRDKLLFNKEEMSKEDVDQFTFGFNIWNYFTTSCFKGYEDAQGGFFAVYRDVFEKIKAEEAKAYNLREDLQEDMRKYEGFGDSTTNEDRVLKFYEDWQNFSTYKTFVWSEEWDTREAGCRWMRRQMQKENKKTRQGERKTYVKTIKDLLSYVRKRDPRFIAYVAKCRQEEEKKEQQRLQREKEKKREKQEMKQVKKRLEEQRFREIEQYYRKQNENLRTTTAHHKVGHSKEDQEHESQFYCQICEKQFKSENQLRNHQKSKQHKQMVKQIEKEVLLKEEIIEKANQKEEDSPQKTAIVESKQEEPSLVKKKKNKKKKNQQQQKQEQQSEPEEAKPQPKQQKKVQVKVQPKKEQSSSDDDDNFMNTLLNNRNKKNETKPTLQQPQPAPKVDKKKPAKVEQSESEQDEKEQQKLGKAKLKKQKKAEQSQKNGKANELKCKVCNEAFPSKTRLFEHINKTGHATAK